MNTNFRRGLPFFHGLSFRLACTALAVVPLGASVASPAEASSRHAAPNTELAPGTLRQRMAEAMGIAPSSVEILSARRTVLPEVNATLTIHKVHDSESGRGSLFYSDDRGELVDGEAWFEEERQRKFAHYGHLAPALHERLSNSTRSELLPVMLHVAGIEKLPDPRGASRSEVDAKTVAKMEGLRKKRNETIVATLNSMFDAYGIEAPSLQVSGRFASAMLPSSSIDAMRHDPRLDYISSMEGKLVLDTTPETICSAKETDSKLVENTLASVRADLVHAEGFDGSGVRVALLEAGPPRIHESCYNIIAQSDTPQGTGIHLAGSLAMFGNTYDRDNGEAPWGPEDCDGPTRGYAPGAELILVNSKLIGDYTDYIKRWEEANSHVDEHGDPIRPHILSMSWHQGPDTDSDDFRARDHYFDWVTAEWPYPSIFAAAGSLTTGFVASKSYNALAVGNVKMSDDPGDRCDLVSDCASLSKDPVVGQQALFDDRELPEIAAPGDRISFGLGVSHKGTSSATPVLASVAALLMEKRVTLKHDPAAMRAILLASANYQGADGTEWNDSFLTRDGRERDGRDGVGVVNAALASTIVETRAIPSALPASNAYLGSDMDASDFDHHGFYTTKWTIDVTDNGPFDRVRVALAWNSQVSSSDGPSKLLADLDLQITAPNGWQHYSRSYSNSYEFVEFHPEQQGEYTIEIRGWRIDPDFDTSFGIAWATYSDQCSELGAIPGWTCDPTHHDAGDGCHCGCGIPDPDCTGTGRAQCDVCDAVGGCGTTAGCPAIDASDNAACIDSWQPSRSYALGDTVLHAGIVYECRQAHASQSGWEPTATPALWQRPVPADGQRWTHNTAYEVGSQVLHAGVLYECVIAHTSLPGQEPSLTPALWQAQ